VKFDLLREMELALNCFVEIPGADEPFVCLPRLENYYQKEIKVVDQRLALAGLRLAAVLNGAFAQVQH
jgi:hypothetical protein